LQRGEERGSLPRRDGAPVPQCRAARSRHDTWTRQRMWHWRWDGVESDEDRDGPLHHVPQRNLPPSRRWSKGRERPRGRRRPRWPSATRSTIDAARAHYGTDGRAWQWGISLPLGGEIPHFNHGRHRPAGAMHQPARVGHHLRCGMAREAIRGWARCHLAQRARLSLAGPRSMAWKPAQAREASGAMLSRSGGLRRALPWTQA
jgi:hypothetical protein